MKKAREAARAEQQRQKEYLKVHDINVDSLQLLSMPQGEQFAKQGQLLCLLRAWKNSQSPNPVIFQDVMANADLGADTPMFIRTTLGEAAWSTFFPT